MKSQATDFAHILEVLLRNDVEFIVVGGVCAALHGVPVTTFDLDVVHSRRLENLSRLVAALDSFDARYRERPEQKLKPRAGDLASSGHHLLMTNAGPLYLLGAIGENKSFDDLLASTTELELGAGRRVKILNLDALIEMKQRLARDKDKAALPLLMRTLEEKRRQGK